MQRRTRTKRSRVGPQVSRSDARRTQLGILILAFVAMPASGVRPVTVGTSGEQP